MPIKIPRDLPAAKTLQEENIFVMDLDRAQSQDIRPLRILVLNLMPTKVVTETQLARLLGNTPLQIEMELMAVNHEHRHVAREHMFAFYKTFDEVKDQFFDGMVITGAPVEHLPFEEVDYWPELCAVMEWTKSHVYSTLHICWGAQAALYYHYGVAKRPLPEKMFGVFPHRVVRRGSILFRGFDDVFNVPHSRHTTVDREDIVRCPGLKILAESEKAGVYVVSTDQGRQLFITGHSEYDTDTLDREYRRDLEAGLPIAVPENYYPDDDPSKAPASTWRSSANLLFANWLNYFVYQATPYNVETIPPVEI